MIKKPSPSLVEHSLTWYLIFLLSFFIICSSITILHYTQQKGLKETINSLEDLRSIRIDLAKGLLFFNTGNTNEAPYNSNQGLALLEQSIETLRTEYYSRYKTASMNKQDTVDYNELNRCIKDFKDDLVKVRESPNKNSFGVSLNLDYHLVDKAAENMDLIIQANGLEQIRKSDFQYFISLTIAILFLIILGLLLLTSRKNQKHFEKDLNETQESIRILMKAGKSGLWDLDLIQKNCYYSAELKKLLGYTEVEWTLLPQNIIKLWHIFLDPQERRNIKRLLFKNIKNCDEDFHIQCSIKLKNNQLKRFLCHIALLRDKNGTLYRLVGIITDLSQVKDLSSSQLVQSKSETNQKNEAIDRLAGGIAHDFNNLLVPIIGYAEMGMQKSSSDSDQFRWYDKIKKVALRAADLTKQVLAISRKQVLHMQALDLNLLIVENEDLIHRLVNEKIVLRIRLSTSPLIIKVDKGQINQVIINLVENAAEAMPDGGVLRIETKNNNEDGYNEFIVADTGIGMDEETQNKIFDPFFTTKKEGKSGGLGLSTVQGIVTQHGGKINVQSSLNKGSLFTISLPTASGLLETTTEERHKLTTKDDGPQTILVVEDEADVKALVKEALENNGYRILEADDPIKALDIIQNYAGTIHLLLSDVVMPRMNGFDLYGRARPIRPNLNILFMSGYSDISALVPDEKEYAFIQKPFLIDDLILKIRVILS